MGDLGRLPPELRNTIYTLVLVDSYYETCDLDPPIRDLDPSTSHSSDWPMSPSSSREPHYFDHALTQTCSLIRSEVRPMWYALDDFEITIFRSNFSRFKTWLDLVGDKDLRQIPVLNIVLQQALMDMANDMEKVVDLLGMKAMRFTITQDFEAM